MPNPDPDERVLVMAPIGQDAAAMASLLAGHGFAPHICKSPADCCANLSSGAGALLLTEEALELPGSTELLNAIKAQPPWSELPLIILTTGGEPRLARLLDVAAAAAGSVTLLERPISTTTLLRSVDVALKARRRQYQIRDLLQEQRRVEWQLRQSEELFRALAENIPQLAWMTRADGGVFWYNQRWFDYTGTTLQQMEGWGWQAVHHPDHLGRVVQKFKQALAVGEPWEDTFPLRSHRGEYRWFLSRAFPIRDAHGRITRWFGTNTDIAELRATQEALRQAQERLQQHAAGLEKAVAQRTADLRATNEQLETFVYSVAHDLRAPLRSMTGYAQLLMDEYAPQLDDAAQHLLRRIQASSQFMDKLLLDLLAYGRTARAEMLLEPVDVCQAWEMALFQCATQIEQLGAHVEAVEPLPTVLAHQATLGQCLANLLSNALKFVRPGEPPRIRFWAEAVGSKVRLWLEDNGIGIAADQQERVFRVFERTHGDRYPGTGIGLSIVRKGAERMGGTVGLESELGKGSRFWIELSRIENG